jgi:hypothetical protein
MDDIETQVCADIMHRQNVGLRKYGVTVANAPITLRGWLRHAYEETLDTAVYLKRSIAEIDAASESDANLKPLVAELLALLEKTEETDEGRPFHPTTIQSCRALDAERLAQLMPKIKKLVE